MPQDMGGKDLQHLRMLYERTNAKAWEPQAPKHPFIQRMIEAGFLRRCDMRCGFEAFKDSGVAWTDAAHLALAQPHIETHNVKQ